MKKLFAVITFALLFGNLPRLPIHAQTSSNYEFTEGWWFEGTSFVRKKLYVVNGVFQKKRPARVDRVIKLDDLYIVPPFGDAHSHDYDNPGTIAKVVETNLRDGIFYGLSLTNSIKGKRSVADRRGGASRHRPTRTRKADSTSQPATAHHGVPIAIGPDLFENAVSEAFYLKQLGVFDARTLLVIWSQTTPQLIFPKRKIGRLAPDYEASLLALSCNPIADFACTRRITLRMKQGRLLSDTVRD